ncbi:hypothetical protein LSAT2_012977 [Lamellibrachia satsuma]|nr:hypothetical protein LSAT2_012977 [Lamellibrachia satsuma]
MTTAPADFKWNLQQVSLRLDRSPPTASLPDRPSKRLRETRPGGRNVNNYATRKTRTLSRDLMRLRAFAKSFLSSRCGVVI